jgi:hypothetical protein
MAQDLTEFEGTPCLNCGFELTGPYCAQCGQRATDVNLSVRTLVVEFADSLFSWEMGFWQTFKRLVFQPGELTREYVVGRRKRYSSPIKLYLGTSLVFFFLMNLFGSDLESANVHIDNEDGERAVMTGREAARMFSSGFMDGITDTTSAATIDSLVALANDIAEKAEAADAAGDTVLAGDSEADARVDEAFEEVEKWKNRFMTYFPRAMFLMVPVSAMLFQLVYWRRQRPFLQNMVFSLHMHALFFFTASVAVLLAQIPPEGVGDALALIVFTTIPINIVRAQRRVFGDSWWKAILRGGVVWHVYGFFLTIVVVGVVLLMVYQAGGFS